MSGDVKLTPAQRDLLASICERPSVVAEHYMPARKLIGMGLAYWRNGHGWDDLIPTEAGRSALSQGEQDSSRSHLSNTPLDAAEVGGKG